MPGRKRKKPKISTKYPIIYILCILLVILIFIFGFYIFKVINLNHSKFIVESRVNEVNSAKQNDIATLKTVGWLRVQGTNIDYPILYGPRFDVTTITQDFAWTIGDFDELNNFVNITGHNIKNLSKHPLITDKKHNRFEQLMSFTYYDFAKDNQFIQYTFNDKEYVYEIFSVSYVDISEFSDYGLRKLSSDEINKFIKSAKNVSLYDYDLDVDENDSLIVLNTCTRMFNDRDKQFRVVGRLLRKNEKIKNKKIKKTKNYQIIEDIMKGGDSYEEA